MACGQKTESDDRPETAIAPVAEVQTGDTSDLPSLESMFPASAETEQSEQEGLEETLAELAKADDSDSLEPEPPEATESEIAEAEKLSPVIVGRLSEKDGEIQRYIEEEDDWTALEKGTPIGVRDSIATDVDTMAEVAFPNNIIWRMGGNTNALIDNLDREVLEISAQSGLVRFTNASSNSIAIFNTGYGTVQADAGSSFEAFIDETLVEVTALKGKVAFITSDEEQSFEVIAGETSLVSDGESITSGEGYVAQEGWVAWNQRQDGNWNSRISKSKGFAKHLPQELQMDAYTLEENGQWMKVPIDGQVRVVYRPDVDADWQPFVNGQWVEYYGDQTFVSYDSFGYITHHYGNWIRANGVWVWAPPYRGRSNSYLSIDYAYLPGRVSWVDSDAYVGWVPLSYTEPYCPNYWGSYYSHYGYDDGYYPCRDHRGRYYRRGHHYRSWGVSYGRCAFFTERDSLYGRHGRGGYYNYRRQMNKDYYKHVRKMRKQDWKRYGKKRHKLQKASFKANNKWNKQQRKQLRKNGKSNRKDAKALRKGLKKKDRGKINKQGQGNRKGNKGAKFGGKKGNRKDKGRKVNKQNKRQNKPQKVNKQNKRGKKNQPAFNKNNGKRGKKNKQKLGKQGKRGNKNQPKFNKNKNKGKRDKPQKVNKQNKRGKNSKPKFNKNKNKGNRKDKGRKVNKQNKRQNKPQKAYKQPKQQRRKQQKTYKQPKQQRRKQQKTYKQPKQQQRKQQKTYKQPK